jgi:prepilin-type processing-associated H-X9-DG protein
LAIDLERESPLYRLIEGVENRVLDRLEINGTEPGGLARAHPRIPVLIERVGNHKPKGGNVAYLDGHVEFIPYPGKWTMTETTVRILNELDSLEFERVQVIAIQP